MIFFDSVITIVISCLMVNNPILGLFFLSIFIFMKIKKGIQIYQVFILLLIMFIFVSFYFNQNFKQTIFSITDFKIVDYMYYNDDIAYQIEAEGKNFTLYFEEQKEILPLGAICTSNELKVVFPDKERNFIKNNEQRTFIMNKLSGKIYEKNAQNITCHSIKETLSIKLNKLRYAYIEKVKSSTTENYIGDILMLSVGSKMYLTSDFFQALQKLGIYHLYVISGTHVAYISLIFFIILRTFRIPLEVIKVVTIFMLLFFFLINVFSPSVLRAVMMAILLILSSFFRKKPYIAVISITAIIQIILNPFILFNAGFVLSYLTTFSILLTRKRLSELNTFLQLVLITLIAEFSTTLVILSHFNELSLSGLLMNIIFDPIFSFIIFPATIVFNIALFTYFPETLDSLLHMIFMFNTKFIMYLSSIVEHRVAIGNLNIFLVCIVLLLTFFILKFTVEQKYKHLIISISVLLSSIFSYSFLNDKDFKLTMIDIGQGDAFLIQDLKNNKNVLIDTGGKYYQKEPRVRLSDKTVLPYLKEQGIRQIDLMVLSHIDIDHMGEYSHIMEKIEVKHLLINHEDEKIESFYETYKDDTKKIIDVHVIRDINVGNIKIENLTQKNNRSKESNASSIVLNIKLNDIKFLFTGDMGVDEERILLNKNIQFDVLKVGHHGSNTSSSDALIQHPFSYALISAGVNNRYKHPHKEVIERLEYYEKFILNTETDGMVEIILEDNKMCIQTKLKKEKNHCIKKES